MLVFLRRVRPDAELACICSAPDRVERNFELAAIRFGAPEPARALLRGLDRLFFRGPHKLASFIRAIGYARTLDVLIIPGTGILDDFGEGPSGVPIVLFVWCLAARLCGTRIAFVSIGAGPIHHPISRWLMKSAAEMAQYRSYRDTVSREFMESIDFDTRHDWIYPDIAFKLPVPSSTRRHCSDHMPPTVGVGVMTYYGWRNDSTSGAAIYETYIDRIVSFVVWLLDRGHPVRILMGDVADRRAVGDVLRRIAIARPDLPRDRLRADPMQNLHDLMCQIVETDIVVATRFHNVVCALKLGKPTVSIGYAEKNDVLMKSMGLGSFCQHVERLNLDLLTEQFTQLVAERSNYEKCIESTNLLYRRQLEQQDSLLASRLL